MTSHNATWVPHMFAMNGYTECLPWPCNLSASAAPFPTRSLSSCKQASMRVRLGRVLLLGGPTDPERGGPCEPRASNHLQPPARAKLGSEVFTQETACARVSEWLAIATHELFGGQEKPRKPKWSPSLEDAVFRSRWPEQTQANYDYKAKRHRRHAGPHLHRPAIVEGSRHKLGSLS